MSEHGIVPRRPDRDEPCRGELSGANSLSGDDVTSEHYGTVAPRIQDDDDLGIRMDWLVFDEVGSGYVEREFRVNQSFRTTTNPRAEVPANAVA